ncbi:alpha/beta hydrolase [Legionella lytica]|uniref:Alpha/beta hydrolase n=1 Tax=Legionella lytica TaxID=96232 RepID=A0ABY4Y6E2_9GAMM|nr:alpha/beta fold hydrolase [Legionella lytica]USQ12727.1 alpha/beta hydrolase [Legionella lytica]
MAKAIFSRYLLVVFILVFSIINAATAQVHPSSTNLKTKHQKEIVILIHGLMRTSMSMRPLKSFLEGYGYQVYLYSYPSARYSIQQHGVRLQHFVDDLIAKNPGKKINFITHSLGGIITREAVSKLKPRQVKQIGCLIMLAPPNQGSTLAKISTKIFPLFTLPIKPLAELSSEESSYVHRVPVPKIKMAIIAGKYDAKVPPEYARLDGQMEPMVISTNHMVIMNNSKVRELILQFLANGRFEKARR